MARIGVIFDMDGVLVDSYAPHLESWRKLAAELGAAISEAQFTGTFGRTSRDIIAEIFGVSDSDGISRLDDRKEQIYRDIIRHAVPAMPGAMEAVRRLMAAGFRIAVGSSGPPENVELVCEEMGLGPYLSAKVTGSDVQRGKPDPQVFQLSAQRMGIEPRACVVVEDAPAGVEAARRAGMRCVALAGTHPAAALQNADSVIESLDELTSELIMELI
ncbi:MAG TPA: HAD family phosphatase [Phycisphaerae bacterium]|nr:HAD family phosphatase [Phycisphaerae bacterium]